MMLQTRAVMKHGQAILRAQENRKKQTEKKNSTLGIWAYSHTDRRRYITRRSKVYKELINKKDVMRFDR